MDVLREELAYYAELEPELKHSAKGQYALIKGQNLIGTFPSAERAYEEGVHRFGNASFLIQAVVETEEPAHVPLLYLATPNAHL